MPEIQLDDKQTILNAKPDFIAMNYYSTATIAASQGNASDKLEEDSTIHDLYRIDFYIKHLERN